MNLPRFHHKNPSIPTQLSENLFNEFFWELIPVPQRGPKGEVPRWRIFNYILKLLYTGCQWKELPIALKPDGRPEISYSCVFKIFRRWLHLGVFGKAFDLSLQRLLEHGYLDISVIHGDGTTTAAKKGGDQIGYNGHKKMKGEKVVAFVDRLCHVLCPFSFALIILNTPWFRMLSF